MFPRLENLPRNTPFASRFVWHFLRLAILLLIFPQVSAAAETSVEAGSVGGTRLALEHYAAVLEDPSETMSLADVQQAETRFIAHGSNGIGFGFSHSAYWLRFKFVNAGDEAVTRFFELANFQMSHVDFYQPQVGGQYRRIQTGQTMPFSSRAYPNRYFVFPIVLPAHSEQFYYLRVQSDDALTIPLRLWEPTAYHAYERNDYWCQAIYLGAVLAMLLFNLLMFFVFRDRMYALYVLFAVSMIFLVTVSGGLGHEFYWPDSTVWNNRASFFAYSVAIIAFLLFLRRVLNIDKVMPKFDWFLLALLILQVVSIVTQTVDVRTTGLFSEVLNFVSAFSLTVLISAVCLYKKLRHSYFIVAGLCVLLLGGCIVGMVDFGYLHSNVWSENAMAIASSLEMILFSSALAQRFNWIRLASSKLQNEIIAAQQALVDSLKESEQILESRVQARTNELVSLNDKLRLISITDELTQVANRRRFNEVLNSEWLRAARAGQVLSLAIVDVDWFKKYNDHYGHQAGDECLRRVAATLANSVSRTGDLVARYGGEEFAFIAPATDAKNALLMAGRVCDALQAQLLPHALSEFGMITVSVGVATVVPGEKDLPDNLLKRADEALYQAKAQGRNRAVLAGEWSEMLR